MGFGRVDVADGGLGSLVTWMGLEMTEREAAAENLPRERKKGGKGGGGGREGRKMRGREDLLDWGREGVVAG